VDGQRSQGMPHSLAKDTGLGQFDIQLCNTFSPICEHLMAICLLWHNLFAVCLQVKDNGLEVMTIEEIRSGIDIRGSGELEKT
jgi:hypothetical protein